MTWHLALTLIEVIGPIIGVLAFLAFTWCFVTDPNDERTGPHA